MLIYNQLIAAWHYQARTTIITFTMEKNPGHLKTFQVNIYSQIVVNSFAELAV